MTDGWICLHRSLLGKGFYRDSEYVHLWVHILMRANHSNTEIMFNGQSMKLSRGQFITGRDALARETGINKSKVYRILKFLESEYQIEQQKTNKFTLITVVNYKKHQDSEQQIEQPVNNKRTTTEQQLNTDNNENNNNNKTKTTSAELQDSSPLFITLTLNDKSEFPITEDQIAEWQELYPAADVRQELRNMRGWLIANSKKRKTKRGILSFVTSWLSRTQDRGNHDGRKPHIQAPAKLPARERVSEALREWEAQQSSGFIDGESVAVDDGVVRRQVDS